jgi:hypothetical protein
MTRRPLQCAAVLAFGAVVLVSCSAGRDSNERATPRAGDPPTLSVRSDLTDSTVVPWRSWRLVEATTLEFTLSTGPTDCYGAYPEVVETDTTVRVRLSVGRIPDAADRECAAIAIESVVPVRLAAPLAARRVEPWR